MEILQGFTKLDKNTKKARNFIRNFVMSKHCTLLQTYDKASKDKIEIYEKWLNFYANIATSANFCIPTFNTYTFTIAFTINKGAQLAYITPKNKYIIDLI